MAVSINSYAELQTVLNDFVNSAGVTPGLAPHGVFWESLTYQEFVGGNVPNVGNYKIVDPGNAAQSNIIQALSGTPNSPFDPNSGSIGQMPQPSPPYDGASPSQSDVIAALSTWINNGCPEFGTAAAEEEAAPGGNEGGGGYSGDGSKSEGESEA